MHEVSQTPSEDSQWYVSVHFGDSCSPVNMTVCLP